MICSSVKLGGGRFIFMPDPIIDMGDNIRCTDPSSTSLTPFTIDGTRLIVLVDVLPIRVANSDGFVLL